MKKKLGFTLIELVMVIILIGIISVIAGRMLSSGFGAYLAEKNVIDADWQGRLALERMVRDMRAIYSITSAASSSITFTDTTNTAITYQLSGTSLLRNGTNLADGIQSMTLSYFDKNGSSTATASLIRYISISVNVTQNNANFSLTTAVYPRNLT